MVENPYEKATRKAFETGKIVAENKEPEKEIAAFQEHIESCLDALYVLNNGQIPRIVATGSEPTAENPKQSRIEFTFQPTAPNQGLMVGIVNHDVRNIYFLSTIITANYSLTNTGHQLESWSFSGPRNSTTCKAQQEISDATLMLVAGNYAAITGNPNINVIDER